MEAEKYKNLLRLYLPGEDLAPGKLCPLSEGQVHYLRNVMRKSAGERLRVFNGRDGEWLCTLVELNKNKALVKADDKLLEQSGSPDVWVIAAPVKKEAFDLMVEKASELGAARFVPVLTERTVVRKINQERLQAIAIEAAEQSERLDVMEVTPLADLKKYLDSFVNGRNLIFCLERAEAESIDVVARKLQQKPRALLIGPEGGFSEHEISFLRKKATYTVSLGPRILRAETALLAALAVLQLVDE